MKYLLIVLVTVFFLFTACRNYPEGERIGSSIMRVVEIKGMPCIIFYEGNQAGMTCDWRKFDSRK